MLREKFPTMKMFKEAKEQSKGHMIILEILIYFVVLVVSTLLSYVPSLIYYMYKWARDPDVINLVNDYNNGLYTYEEYAEKMTNFMDDNLSMLIALFATGISIAVVLIYCRFIEKRKLSTTGLRRDKFVLEYLIGLGVGAGLLAITVGINVLFGAASVHVVQSFNVGMIALFFVGYMVQGMNEEILTRGAFMVSMSRKAPIAAAVAVSSVSFGLMHLGNPGVTVLAVVNISLFGIFQALYIMKRGNIWGAAGIHSMWNFMQGNFFGISVSGLEKTESVFSTDFSESGALLNGGSFGCEGGLAVTIVTTIAIAVLIFVKPKQSEIAEETAEEITEIEKSELVSEPSDV